MSKGFLKHYNDLSQFLTLMMVLARGSTHGAFYVLDHNVNIRSKYLLFLKITIDNINHICYSVYVPKRTHLPPVYVLKRTHLPFVYVLKRTHLPFCVFS